MAHTSGTATDYLDLLDKFDAFVTAGLGSQNWTQLKDDTGESNPDFANDRHIYYRAPGLAGTEQIYVVMSAFHNVGNDYYNLEAIGATGYNAGARHDLQPGTSKGSYLLAWNASIPYWFIGNGRCAKIIAKISGVYQSMYVGFIIPHGSPSEYPYPMFIGGMHANPRKRWSNTDTTHKAFWNPCCDSSANPIFNNCSGAFLCLPGHTWVGVGNYTTGTEFSPTNGAQSTKVWPYTTRFEQVEHIYGDSTGYALMPLTLTSGASAFVGVAGWGEFDGVYFVSGFSNAVENIITVSGVDYLVVQNAFRSSGPDHDNIASNQYAAFSLV
jgi:hypothetical protein